MNIWTISKLNLSLSKVFLLRTYLALENKISLRKIKKIITVPFIQHCHFPGLWISFCRVGNTWLLHLDSALLHCTVCPNSYLKDFEELCQHSWNNVRVTSSWFDSQLAPHSRNSLYLFPVTIPMPLLWSYSSRHDPHAYVIICMICLLCLSNVVVHSLSHVLLFATL